MGQMLSQNEELLLPMGTWAVMVLSPFGEELARAGRLLARLRQDLGEERDFKPVIGEPDGPASSYVFLPLVAASEQRLIALERRRYCEMVLSHGQGSARRLSLVQKHEMMRMMSAGTEAVQDLKRGDAIRVVGGRYIRVHGRVLQPRYPDVHHLVIQVKTRTMERSLVVQRREVEAAPDRSAAKLSVLHRRHCPRTGEQLRLVP